MVEDDPLTYLADWTLWDVAAFIALVVGLGLGLALCEVRDRVTAWARRGEFDRELEKRTTPRWAFFSGLCVQR